MALNLSCAENSISCFSDLPLDGDAADEFGISHSWHHDHDHQVNQNHIHYEKDSFSNNDDGCCQSLITDLTIHSEDRVKEMVEREKYLLPRDDYLKRLRSGDLDMSSRREAVDWIWKVQAHYSFGAISVCLSMNYLDRFISVYQLPKDKAWTVQLLAVACLSLAAKMEEPNAPLSVDLQVGEPKFVFEAKTIQRMELLVLNTLKWRMQALTPCSFLDYYLAKMSGNQHLSPLIIATSFQLILSIVKGIDFLEFRPSEIAAAVAMSVQGDAQEMDIDSAMPSFIHVEKDRVMKCMELIKDLCGSDCSTRSRATSCGDDSVVGSGSNSYMPQSPNGVLEATCLSLSLSSKSDDITVGSCANSSHDSTTSNTTHSPDPKKRKLS